MIVVQLTVEGFHKWEGCNIPDVMFLKERHRHQFHIVCKKEVSELDRQIEFFVFQRQIKDWVEQNFGTPCEFGEMSCEMIAKELLNQFDLDSCFVNEDGENGAEVSR